MYFFLSLFEWRVGTLCFVDPKVNTTRSKKKQLLFSSLSHFFFCVRVLLFFFFKEKFKPINFFSFKKKKKKKNSQKRLKQTNKQKSGRRAGWGFGIEIPAQRNVKPVSFETAVGPFPRAHDLFGDGSVFIVDAPGHWFFFFFKLKKHNFFIYPIYNNTTNCTP